MTARTQFTVTMAELVRAATPDFSQLDSMEAQRHIRALAASGWTDETIATLAGWDRTDVRRALSPPSAGHS